MNASEALDEVLGRIFGQWTRTWREVLADADATGTPDDAVASVGLITYGDFRRWAAPLIAERR